MQKSPSDNDRNECLKKAESCLEEAGKDEARRTYWIAQAAEWIHRARAGTDAETNQRTDAGLHVRAKTGGVTHEVSGGRMIPKPTTK